MTVSEKVSVGADMAVIEVTAIRGLGIIGRNCRNVPHMCIALDTSVSNGPVRGALGWIPRVDT